MRVPNVKRSEERGIALIVTLLVMMLISAVLVGFVAIIMSDQRFRFIDRDRTRAFYASSAGLEKLTADLGTLFATNYAPTAAMLTALEAVAPAIPGMTYVKADGTNGYRILFTPKPDGNPDAQYHNIQSGPYQGLIGLTTQYTIDVTARTATGGEVHLQRTLQTVAIPVFQFGIFSDVDLSFFPGPPFNFGGRVHTNGNLFLSAGNTLTISEKVTAVKQIVRQFMSNGVSIDVAPTHNGVVTLITAPGALRNYLRTEGSVQGALGSAPTANWTNISLGTYNGNIRNGETGARRLDLALITAGGSNPDMVRRAAVNEDVAKPALFGERYFKKASLRILLSDDPADITDLPTVTGTAPVLLDGDWAAAPPFGYGPVDANHPPIARSPGIVGGPNPPFLTPAGTGLIGGYLKIERQNAAGDWNDVTMELLNLGFASRNIQNGACNVQPNPDAVIRLQRVAQPSGVNPPCGIGSTASTSYWPQVLFDVREALTRDAAPPGNPIVLGGVMHYIAIDAANLARWFRGEIGTTGADSISNNGFTVYFSDRRNNADAAGNETGDYGWEDVVNPNSVGGAPNGSLDQGEDFNGNGTLDQYGQFPASVAAGSVAPLDDTARPWTQLTANQAERNRAVLFRHALKLTNGALGNIIAPGLTVVSENPVYIEGDWNASTAAGFADPHVATAVIADAVTLLSNNWNDHVSFTSPYNTGGRPRANTYYRVAIIGGKGPAFDQPAGTATDFGTDGGTHNFLRMLESGGTVNYRGSIATFYYNRQATGTYKCCNTVYGAPTRQYSFDTDFLDPSKLPPLTPAFRDLNTLGFSQELRPGK